MFRGMEILCTFKNCLRFSFRHKNTARLGVFLILCLLGDFLVGGISHGQKTPVSVPRCCASHRLGRRRLLSVWLHVNPGFDFLLLLHRFLGFIPVERETLHSSSVLYQWSMVKLKVNYSIIQRKQTGLNYEKCFIPNFPLGKGTSWLFAFLPVHQPLG